MTEHEPLSYQKSGVDVDEADRLVKAIGPLAKKTQRSECLDTIGGFGALFKVPLDRYRRPVLVSGTDGVGTKLMLARQLGKHDSIGIDLVAMCVNDIIVQGAEPLFFLDYFATGRLEAELATTVVAGIATGCHESGAALVGGETAEMPGMYSDTDYDLAGFCVGIVEQEKIIDGNAVNAGQAIIGLASSGAHSNGFSLIRRIVERYATSVDGDPYQTRPFDDSKTLGESLLTPTRIYVKPLLQILEKFSVTSLAHITGGGITDNVARVLPDGCHAKINSAAWPQPALFDWLQGVGAVDTSEMFRTFNCGIGMVMTVDQTDAQGVISELAKHDIKAWDIGVITTDSNNKTAVTVD